MSIKLLAETEHVSTLFMQPARLRVVAVLLACALPLQPNGLTAEQVPVRHKEGLMHGFLALRTLEGKKLADGEMTQVTEGDRRSPHRRPDLSLQGWVDLRGQDRIHSERKLPTFERSPHEERTVIQTADGNIDRRFYRESHRPLQRPRRQRESLEAKA